MQLHRILIGVVCTAFAASGCNCGGENLGSNGSAVSQITSPSEGAVLNGAPLIITGTASATVADLQKVEISLDQGATWQLATGTSDWTYALNGADGAYLVMSRATNM